MERRKLMKVGGVAVVGAVAAMAAQASPAAAGTDGDVVLAKDNVTNAQRRTAILDAFADNELFGVFNSAGLGTAIRGRAGSDAGFWPADKSTLIGIYGESHDGVGVIGRSVNDSGVVGSSTNVYGVSGETPDGVAGVFGSSNSGLGVEGFSVFASGLWGASDYGEGVYARSGSTDGTNPSATGSGVHGVTDSTSDAAVWGEAVNGGIGVSGSTNSHTNAAVFGDNAAGAPGVDGRSFGTGVQGICKGSGPGVAGYCQFGEGVYARSGQTDGTTPGATRNGVHGVTDSASDAGVWGESLDGGFGVLGSTSGPSNGGVAGSNAGSGPGVDGRSLSGPGVRGIANSAAAGVAGYCQTGEGVYARSGQTDGTTPGATRNGVHGVTDSASASGVWGEALGGGAGVTGSTTSASEPGVSGVNHGNGPGVLAQNDGGGSALQVNGPSLFSRSGVVTIPSGQTKATVTPPGGLSAAALVLALMQNSAGGVFVKAAIPNPGAGTFQIVLNNAPVSPATAKVAWFVVN
jgi:hypothetical protein